MSGGALLENAELMHLISETPSYRVIRWLGEGQTSVVCLAERSDSRGLTKQAVVLKILKSEKRVQWLKREFDVLRSVDSPHCVRVLAWDNLPGEGPALVLEPIEGVSLAELARVKAFSRGEADEAARQIQLGLKALRAAGVCHGDLSAANALVDVSGRVCLIDFGAPPPEEGVAATPAYAAPELWRGQRPDFASDLFSLGLLHFDLIDGMRTADLLSGLESARARAEKKCSPKHPWLSPDAGLRSTREIGESEKARVGLGRRAELMLQARRERSSLKTTSLAAEVAASLPGKTLSTRRSPRVRPLFLFMAAIVIGIPRQVVSNQGRSHWLEKRASIDLRPKFWKEIWINGERVGFAPLRLDGLRAGEHRIAWSANGRSGEIRVKADEGAIVTLRESDFKPENFRKSASKVAAP